MLHLPHLVPPTVLYSIDQDCLLLACPTSSEVEPLSVLEFLHRIADALEDFLGAPLLTGKIEANYDVVAQVVVEVCDAGLVCNTEPNALKETVEVPNWVGNILGGIGLPANSPSLAGRNQTLSLPGNQRSALTGGISNASNTSAAGSAIPWRRSNVRHTSNELYVDIVEMLSVVVAPSGRPLSAIVNGTIAFTAKISGVPDLLLTLSAPGGKAGIHHAMETPSFHPCVRLARWRDRPGEMSFVPPDGRFVLAGYECNLLPDLFTSDSATGKIQQPNLTLPISVEVETALGPLADEVEVRIAQPLRGSSRDVASTGHNSGMAQKGASGTSRLGVTNIQNLSSGSTSPAAGPVAENILVTVPIPSVVRNVANIRCSRGEASYAPSEAALEWRLSTKEALSVGSAGATIRCTLVGPAEGVEVHQSDPNGLRMHATTYDYDETADGPYQPSQRGQSAQNERHHSPGSQESSSAKKNAAMMPRCAIVSFNVKGWLASGIKVDSLTVNTRTSKGLGAGVTPYKGVKYHTVSQQGVEIRC